VNSSRRNAPGGRTDRHHDGADWRAHVRRRRRRGTAATIVARLLAIRRYTDRAHAEQDTDVARTQRSEDGRPSTTSDRDRRRDADVVDDQRQRAVVGDGGSPRFTVREVDRGLLVVADLKGVVRDDQQTEIDLSDDALVLTVDNRFAWRVPVEDGHSSITDVSLNNDVLEARVDVGD